MFSVEHLGVNNVILRRVVQNSSCTKHSVFFLDHPVLKEPCYRQMVIRINHDADKIARTRDKTT